MSNSLQPHGLQSTSLIYPWDFPGKNIGMGFHARLWGYSDSGVELASPESPFWQVNSLPLSHLGSPYCYIQAYEVCNLRNIPFKIN